MKYICDLPGCNLKAIERGFYGIDDDLTPYNYCKEHFVIFNQAWKDYIKKLDIAHIEVEINENEM